MVCHGIFWSGQFKRFCTTLSQVMKTVRDRPLENLWDGAGGEVNGEVQKKNIFALGKIK